jgi:hypothetical protein
LFSIKWKKKNNNKNK